MWPVIQTGCVPVLVDSDIDTLCINTKEVEDAITPRTKAIFVAHILGNAAEMQKLEQIASHYGLILIEDTCESLGTKYIGKMVGTFGEMGSYSFFFSHHITTIEGGMVVTNSDRLAEILRSIRWFLMRR